MMEEKFGKEDIIEGVPDKSLEEITKEVQDEFNLTDEEIIDALNKLDNESFVMPSDVVVDGLGEKVSKKKTLKKNKKPNVIKAKRKQAKKSKRQNR